MKLQSLLSREVLDSRGNPTVAVRATLADGSTAEAMVPSGASTGSHEALELRDNDEKRYGGKGVLQACANVTEKIFPLLRDMDVEDQRAVDQAMIALDGTPNKAVLGANAILGVSLAIARAVAVSRKLPLYVSLRQTFGLGEPRLPYQMMNVLNGGVHADNGLDIQEFMIIPQHARLAERVRMGAEIFHTLKKILQDRGNTTAVGDEGGFAPHIARNEEGLVLLKEAVEKAGHAFGTDVKLGLDVAASEFFKNGSYRFDGAPLTAAQLTAKYSEWIEKYALASIEDGLSEDDWQNWQTHTRDLGGRTILVGDDLFVTNVARLQQGIDQGVANAILIKVNQIGSLTETIDTILLAQKNHYTVCVSHRSGETEDTTIADLAVAVGAEYIKTGSLSRSERVAKYNRLMAIEAELL